MLLWGKLAFSCILIWFSHLSRSAKLYVPDDTNNNRVGTYMKGKEGLTNYTWSCYLSVCLIMLCKQKISWNKKFIYFLHIMLNIKRFLNRKTCPTSHEMKSLIYILHIMVILRVWIYFLQDIDALFSKSFWTY